MTIESALTSMNYRAERASRGVWKVFMDSNGDPEIRTDSGFPETDKLPVLREGGRDETTTALDMFFVASARSDLPRVIFALRKALKPHQPVETDEDGYEVCAVCNDPEIPGAPASWPCETVRNAALALGEEVS